MHVLLVMCEGTQGRLPFETTLKTYGDCEPISEGVYAVRTAMPAEELSHSLRAQLQPARVFVLPIRKSYTGWAPETVRRWLDEQNERGD
jgi:hypothetical protein